MEDERGARPGAKEANSKSPRHQLRLVVSFLSLLAGVPGRVFLDVGVVVVAIFSFRLLVLVGRLAFSSYNVLYPRRWRRVPKWPLWADKCHAATPYRCQTRHARPVSSVLSRPLTFCPLALRLLLSVL